ncbi:Zinc finger MYM-type protein 1 [Frankliniella fusca]|uniref:Zinc finger MYM-type protein 1 n=1 Tax=Frankliniella fusca TaxID=407009 RepID=A0AAE1H742_9NEOP|nr:Zinc finger MYM-type protein 1 [Frankliniella fusca]
MPKWGRYLKTYREEWEKETVFKPTVVSDEDKITDIRLALFIATHCAVKSIDHLGELLKQLGKGSPLGKIRIHRTKCSKIISHVIAPAFLTELVTDVGNSPYAVIADEATDCSTSKFMGMCIRYFSTAKKTMVTDFLGLVQVTGTTGKQLADALKEYLRVIGIPLVNMTAVGTDGAPNIAVRKADFEDYYKTLNNDKKAGVIPRMVETRWLSWLPGCEFIVSNWIEMREFFGIAVANAKDDKARAAASHIHALYKDQALYLYMLFLRNILREVQKVNLAFQHTNADVTKLHSELRKLIFSVASRILKDQAMPKVDRAGVIRMNEIRALQEAMRNSANHLPLDMANFGEAFRTAVPNCKLSEAELRTVRNTCGQYIYTLCIQLFDRLPSNIEAVEKLRFFRPNYALAVSARPKFRQLPLDLLSSEEDPDVLESQWNLLGNTPLSDICPHPDHRSNLEEIDIFHFWACVLTCTNAAGDFPFRELARFALRCLTLPLSNAVVERIFSFLAAVKSKQRNRLQLLMIEALLRIRVHFKVIGECCQKYTPSTDMVKRFSSKMYASQSGSNLSMDLDENPDDPDPDAVAEIDDEDYAALTIFSSDDTGACCTIEFNFYVFTALLFLLYVI